MTLVSRPKFDAEAESPQAALFREYKEARVPDSSKAQSSGLLAAVAHPLRSFLKKRNERLQEPRNAALVRAAVRDLPSDRGTWRLLRSAGHTYASQPTCCRQSGSRTSR